MKCPKCNREIEDDSVFCEYCGEKIKKQSKVELQEDCERVEQENNQQVLKTSKNKLKIKKWHIITAAGVLFTVICFIILHAVRKNGFYRDAVGAWPSCQKGPGAFYVLQNSEGTKLVQLNSSFLYTYQTLQSYERWYDGEVKIYSCEGDHSFLAAFASLHPNGKVDFILNYGRGGLFSHDGRGFTVLDIDGTTDEAHLFGFDGDNVCGAPQENVRGLFYGMNPQPVRMNYDRKWHYLDIENNVSPIGYDDAYPYCYGLARVQNNGRWYYINGDGTELQLEYTEYSIIAANNFQYSEEMGEPVAFVELSKIGGHIEGWINRVGEMVKIAIAEEAAE